MTSRSLRGAGSSCARGDAFVDRPARVNRAVVDRSYFYRACVLPNGPRCGAARELCLGITSSVAFWDGSAASSSRTSDVDVLSTAARRVSGHAGDRKLSTLAERLLSDRPTPHCVLPGQRVLGKRRRRSSGPAVLKGCSASVPNEMNDNDVYLDLACSSSMTSTDDACIIDRIGVTTFELPKLLIVQKILTLLPSSKLPYITLDLIMDKNISIDDVIGLLFKDEETYTKLFIRRFIKLYLECHSKFYSKHFGWTTH
ncbi:hypothetical protein PR202_ga27455 [Eleusine coracana subsp. coracana]|uniref:Uncharacterized protein n=1 Tax=Eleusine coracana subsp. coracana TaxID=191504 RepID=A0AAV5DEV1_ELECO|nr:hypothetical protein PR202_ga27455 [Eleusine coracana subsp. coracana]